MAKVTAESREVSTEAEAGSQRSVVVGEVFSNRLHGDTIAQQNNQHNRKDEINHLHANHGIQSTLQQTLANEPQEKHCQAVNSDEETQESQVWKDWWKQEMEAQAEKLAQALADEWQGVRPHEETIYVRVA